MFNSKKKLLIYDDSFFFLHLSSFGELYSTVGGSNMQTTAIKPQFSLNAMTTIKCTLETGY